MCGTVEKWLIISRRVLNTTFLAGGRIPSKGQQQNSSHLTEDRFTFSHSKDTFQNKFFFLPFFSHEPHLMLRRCVKAEKKNRKQFCPDIRARHAQTGKANIHQAEQEIGIVRGMTQTD